MIRYMPTDCIPLGSIPLIGSTMTPEREQEITRDAALKDMPRLGLEPTPDNLPRYFQMVREVLR